MNIKDLHESWVKTGYPSRTEIRKAIEGLLAEQSQTPTEAGLREELTKAVKHCQSYSSGWGVVEVVRVEILNKILGRHK